MAGYNDSGQFDKHYGSVEQPREYTQTSGYNLPSNPENSSSISPSFQICDKPVQCENYALNGHKSQHVRFNVQALCTNDVETGLTVEEQSSLPVPEVIVLSSDDEEPPKSKRPRHHPASNSDVFPTVTADSSVYGLSRRESNLVQVLPPSDDRGQLQSLNDSLEEFDTLPPLECPLSRGQSVICYGEKLAPVNQQEGALPEQTALALCQTPNEVRSTPNGIYSDFNITVGDSSSSGTSMSSYLRQDYLFNSSHVSVDSSSSNSAVGLLQSTYWDGKAPTQKQIRESVRNSLADYRPKPGTHDPFPPLNNHITNTARMAREYFSGIAPPGFMAGAIVRKTPPSNNSHDSHTATLVSSESVLLRTPVKSLSLGREDGRMIRLESDDRAMTTVGASAHEAAPNYPHSSTAVLGTGSINTHMHQWQRTRDSERNASTDGNNYNEIRGNYPSNTYSYFGGNERGQVPINRFADLKAFHQFQNRPLDYRTHASLPRNGIFNAPKSIASGSIPPVEPDVHVVDDPWMGCGVIGPPVKAKVHTCMHAHT